MGIERQSVVKQTEPDRNSARQRILATVDVIPRGRVASYGQVAREAGLVGRARMVGHVLRTESRAGLPWHRVLNARGHSSFPEGSAARKEQLERLRREGVAIDRHGKVDLRNHAWYPEA